MQRTYVQLNPISKSQVNFQVTLFQPLNPIRDRKRSTINVRGLKGKKGEKY